MAKMTIDERIEKIIKTIEKETTVILKSKEKIKTLQKELKSLRDEQNRAYANLFIGIIVDNGLKTDEQKKQFIESCAKAAKGLIPISAESNNEVLSGETAGDNCDSRLANRESELSTP